MLTDRDLRINRDIVRYVGVPRWRQPLVTMNPSEVSCTAWLCLHVQPAPPGAAAPVNMGGVNTLNICLTVRKRRGANEHTKTTTFDYEVGLHEPKTFFAAEATWIIHR